MASEAGFEAVAAGVVAFSGAGGDAAFFACQDEVFHTMGTANRRVAAFDAEAGFLHSQAIFGLPRNRQIREFVVDTRARHWGGG